MPAELTPSAAQRVAKEAEPEPQLAATLAATLAHPEIAHLTRALERRPGREVEPDPPMRLAAIALLATRARRAKPL